MNSNKKCKFTSSFMGLMFENMWTFVNPSMISDMIAYMFPDMDQPIKLTSKARINDDRWPLKYHNSICFKGKLNEGHYVYVANNGIAYGTYECNLLRCDADDGICHGAALCFYLNMAHGDNRFHLYTFPKTEEDFQHNYKTILDLYILLIESGAWDNALEQNFYQDVHWIPNTHTTNETQISLATLKKYNTRFQPPAT